MLTSVLEQVIFGTMLSLELALLIFGIVKYVLSKHIITADRAASVKSIYEIEYRFWKLQETDRKDDIQLLEKFCSFTFILALEIPASFIIFVVYGKTQSDTHILNFFLASHIINLLNKRSVYAIAAVVLHGALAYTSSWIVMFVLVFNASENVHLEIEKIHEIHKSIAVVSDTKVHEILTHCIIQTKTLNRVLHVTRRWVFAIMLITHVLQFHAIFYKDVFILVWLCYQLSVP
jgi:hypothetical protein